MKKFIVMSYPRTGSTLLVRMLNNVEDVICHSEIFHNDFTAFRRAFLDGQIINRQLNKSLFSFFWNEDKILKKLFKLKKNRPQQFLDEIYRCKAKAVGFKLFPGQQDDLFSKLVSKKDVLKIILERTNRLRSYISEQISLKTNKWDLYEGEKPDKVHLTVDTDDFFNYKGKIDEYLWYTEDQLRNTNQRYLKLTYEEVTGFFSYKKFFDFLTIPEVNSVSNHINQKKQNPFSLKEIINNYDQVERELRKAGLEHYLTDEQITR